MSTPDEGLWVYTFDVIFGGTLEVLDFDCILPPGAVLGCASKPDLYSAAGLGAPPPFVMVPGGIVFQVASFVVAINAEGGLVETGEFQSGNGTAGPDAVNIIDQYSWGSIFVSDTPPPVPEPSAASLVLLSLAGLAWRRRGRSRGRSQRLRS